MLKETNVGKIIYLYKITKRYHIHDQIKIIIVKTI